MLTMNCPIENFHGAVVSQRHRSPRSTVSQSSAASVEGHSQGQSASASRTAGAPSGGGTKRQDDLEPGSTPIGRPSRDTPIVSDDGLLGQGKAQPGSVSFGGEEGPENAIAGFWIDPGTIIADAEVSRLLVTIDGPMQHDQWCHPRLGTCLKRVAAQVGKRLSQETFVPFDVSELAFDPHLASATLGFGSDLLCGAHGQATERDRGQGEPCRSRKVQEVIDYLAQ